MSMKNKLSASFNNPLLIDPELSVPNNVAIIGSGTIGPDIGYFFKSALPDITLYLVDVAEKQLVLAEKRIDSYLQKGIDRKKIKPELAEKIKKGLVYTSRYEDISDCELVIEAATENIGLKRNIFSKIEKLVSERAILTSNTSSIPANRIFSDMMRSDRTAVTHFFAPAWRSLPVEVVGWDKTSKSTVDFLCWLFALTGKVPITTKDSVCFMLDRIFDNWCNEAAHLLSDASSVQIDKVSEEFVYAGPFFVLNMAKGNPIIFETNSLQMEEGECYKPDDIFNSVDKWLTSKPGANFMVAKDIHAKVRDRLLGIFFSQAFDVIDREIGTLADLNFGSEVALGFRKGPMDLMRIVGESEVERIGVKFEKERSGFPKSKQEFGYYQDFKRYILEDTIGKIKILTIRRPQAMNALNDDITNEILELLKQYSKDTSVDGFIIVGYGASAFSAGADIGKFPEMLGDYDSSVQYARNCAELQCFIDDMDKPIVAAVNGVALGGGLEIAIRCHGIVANKNSVFQFPEVSLGILPGIGGCIVPYRKWPKGVKTFDQMILFAKKIGVAEANKIGMLNDIADGYQSLIKKAINTVYKIKENFSSVSGRIADSVDIKLTMPESRDLIKLNLSCETVAIIVDTIMSGAMAKNLSEALEIGYEGFGRAACTDSASEGVSAFLERRRPLFNK